MNVKKNCVSQSYCVFYVVTYLQKSVSFEIIFFWGGGIFFWFISFSFLPLPSRKTTKSFNFLVGGCKHKNSVKN